MEKHFAKIKEIMFSNSTERVATARVIDYMLNKFEFKRCKVTTPCVTEYVPMKKEDYLYQDDLELLCDIITEGCISNTDGLRLEVHNGKIRMIFDSSTKNKSYLSSLYKNMAAREEIQRHREKNKIPNQCELSNYNRNFTNQKQNQGKKNKILNKYKFLDKKGETYSCDPNKNYLDQFRSNSSLNLRYFINRVARLDRAVLWDKFIYLSAQFIREFLLDIDYILNADQIKQKISNCADIFVAGVKNVAISHVHKLANRMLQSTKEDETFVQLCAFLILDYYIINTIKTVMHFMKRKNHNFIDITDPRFIIFQDKLCGAVNSIKTALLSKINEYLVKLHLVYGVKEIFV